MGWLLSSGRAAPPVHMIHDQDTEQQSLSVCVLVKRHRSKLLYECAHDWVDELVVGRGLGNHPEYKGPT